MAMALESEIEVYRDGKRSETLKVVRVEYDRADIDRQVKRIGLATCPGRYCTCSNCQRMRKDAEMAAKAPLGKRFDEGRAGYVAVILAGRKQIRVLALFPDLWGAVAYVKANYKCKPVGKTKFQTKDGDVLIVQRGVHILAMEEA